MIVYVCICMYMYVYVCICMYVYAYVCICMHMYAYVCICMYMYVCVLDRCLEKPECRQQRLRGTPGLYRSGLRVQDFNLGLNELGWGV